MGAVRAQGHNIEIPTLDDAKKYFNDWLMGEPDDHLDSDETMMRRALGLGER